MACVIVSPGRRAGRVRGCAGRVRGVEDLEVDADRRDVDRDLAVPVAACAHQASLLVDRLERRDGGRDAFGDQGQWGVEQQRR
jgi:hypothetical protein